MRPPRLLWITPSTGSLTPLRELARAIPAPLRSHVALLLRRPEDTDRAVAEAAHALVSLPLRVFVQRLDIALAVNADGVHLPERGLRPSDLPRDRFCVGASRHDEAGVVDALGEGADYVTLSPVFATPGKGEPIGVEAFAEVARKCAPVLGLGGVSTGDHAGELARAGAYGVAAIRGVRDVKSVEAMLTPFRQQYQ